MQQWKKYKANNVITHWSLQGAITQLWFDWFSVRSRLWFDNSMEKEEEEEGEGVNNQEESNQWLSIVAS